LDYPTPKSKQHYLISNVKTRVTTLTGYQIPHIAQ
jgi:hypothetical protein